MSKGVLDIASACAYVNRVRIVDGLGLKISDQAAERASLTRDHAQVMAGKQGVSLPPDVWGVTEQAATAKAKA